MAALSQAVTAQKNVDDPRLWDSFNASGCEYLLNRLDGVIGDAFQKPTSKIFLVLRAGENPIQNYFYERYVRKGIAFRKLPLDRVSVISAKGNGRLGLDFWISDSGLMSPKVNPTVFDLALPSSESKIPFATDTVEVVKIGGRWEYLAGDCVACCIETVDIELLSRFLKANPHLRANVSVYTESRRTWNRLSKLLRSEVRSYSVPDKRVRIHFGHTQNWVEGFASNIATIEIQLVRFGHG
jgi:hypothetical protein